jgi:hypothetical protein
MSPHVETLAKSVPTEHAGRDISPLPSRFAAAASASLRNVLSSQDPHIVGRRFATAPSGSPHRRQPIPSITTPGTQTHPGTHPLSKKMTTIAPSDFDADILIEGSAGQMKFDPVMKRWVRISPDGVDQKSTNEDDPFDEFDSSGPHSVHRSASFRVPVPLERDDSDVEEVEVDLDDMTDSDSGQESWNEGDPKVDAEEAKVDMGGEEQEAEDENVTDNTPNRKDDHGIPPSTPSPSTPAPPNRAGIQPRSVLKTKNDSVAITPDRSVSSSPKVPRSVSFSDGRTSGKILGLHDDELAAQGAPASKGSKLKNEVAVLTESDAESSPQTDDGDSQSLITQSARVKRFEDALDELEQLGMLSLFNWPSDRDLLLSYLRRYTLWKQRGLYAGAS